MNNKPSSNHTVAVVSGPDPNGIEESLTEHGVTVHRVTGVLSQDVLAEAQIRDADFFILTDIDQALAISIAFDLNPEIKLIIYAAGTVPDYIRAQLDFAIDPNVLDPTILVEELIE